MSGTHYLSQEGYDKLRADLDEMKSTGRANVAAAIAEAREKGDLSENAEYDAAKDAQGLLEMKINELEKIMANARVLDSSLLDTSRVTVMSKVTIKNLANKKDLTYTLVAESEADLKAKKISVNSPVGQALLGREVGDKVEVNMPNGAKPKFKIMNITI